MEDRLTPGLYLEMSDATVDDYVADRGHEILSQPGVTGGSWWANAAPGRTDLPRELPEHPLLALFELTDDFVAPNAPPDVTALHYRRCPRPGQGILTGNPTTGLSVVLISPRGRDGAPALRDWADFVHIRHIVEAAVPGYGMITPYEHATGGDPRYLHLYEMDTDDPEGAFRSMTPLVEARIGAAGTSAWRRWAFHPDLRIMYVNTFTRIGAS